LHTCTELFVSTEESLSTDYDSLDMFVTIKHFILEKNSYKTRKMQQTDKNSNNSMIYK